MARACVTCGAIPGPGRGAYCSDDCKPRCVVDGCERPGVEAAPHGCRTHMSAYYKRGRFPLSKWATEKRCVVCGATDWPEKGRSTCSPRCRQLLHLNGGTPPPLTVDCVRCGALIDLTATSPKSGRKRRADTKVCEWCRKAKRLRHGVSVGELRARDGDGCGICGEGIDFSLPYPSPGYPTVDHVLPYALGGQHDSTNLQLAHLTCNVTKQARAGWTPPALDAPVGSKEGGRGGIS